MTCAYTRDFPQQPSCPPGDCFLKTCEHHEEAQRFERRDTRDAYLALIPPMRAAARAVGYALGVHGSLVRDLDLIAVPWAEDAASAEDLVAAVLAAVKVTNKHAHLEDKAVTLRPHGRRAWSIFLSGGHAYIDLSVMPLTPPSPEHP